MPHRPSRRLDRHPLRTHHLWLSAAVMACCCSITHEESRAEDLYGAIAYSQSTKRYGYAWGKSTRTDAESAALRECGASDAFIAVWGKNTWLALAHGRGTSYGWDWDDSQEVAKSRALWECAQRASGCHLLVVVYAGGEGNATLTASVPPNTKVFVGDHELPVTDGIAQLESPKLLGGKRYTYTVTARMELGEDVIEEQVVAGVYAFQTTRVSFAELDVVSELSAPPRRASDVFAIPDRFAP